MQVQAGGPLSSTEEKPIEELADAILRSMDAPQKVPDTRMNWTIARAEDPDGLKRLDSGRYKSRR